MRVTPLGGGAQLFFPEFETEIGCVVDAR